MNWGCKVWRCGCWSDRSEMPSSCIMGNKWVIQGFWGSPALRKSNAKLYPLMQVIVGRLHGKNRFDTLIKQQKKGDMLLPNGSHHKQRQETLCCRTGTWLHSSSFNVNEANLLRGGFAVPVSVQTLQICLIGRISVIHAIQVQIQPDWS